MTSWSCLISFLRTEIDAERWPEKKACVIPDGDLSMSSINWSMVLQQALAAFAILFTIFALIGLA